MNKKLKTYFEQLGLLVEGNNAYGKLNGYEVSVNVAIMDTVSPVKIHVNLYAPDATKLTIVNEIKNQKFKYFVVGADVYGITLGFNDPLTIGKLLNRMPEMLDKIFAIIKRCEAKGEGYCPICGEPLKDDAKKYRISWSMITLDTECVGNLNNVIEAENKDFKKAPNNYGRGICGALIGALVGVIAFVILFFMGYISALTSFISVLLGSFLYKKFGGKPNVVMIVTVSVVSVASMILALFGIYVLAAQVLVLDYDFTSTGIQAFNDMMTIKEFSQEFTTNLVMTVLYTGIGIAFEIYRLSKSIRRPGTIK